MLSALILLAVSAVPTLCQGQEVWSGRDYYFEKKDYADWTDPENQDQITPLVWITRANNQGIFNIHNEQFYIPFTSPSDTQWATGEAADWPNLNFQSWQGWAHSDPQGTIGIDAVVHLVTEDIYIDIRFESWTCCDLGGGFSYLRAQEPATPVQESTWGRIKGSYR